MKAGQLAVSLKKKAAFLILLLISLSTLTGYSQSVRVDSTKFAIGSSVNLILELPASGTDKIVWPKIGDTITKSVEVLSKSKIDTIINEGTGQKTIRQVISITSFDTGFIAVPPFSFSINGQKSSTEALLLEVYKLKIDPVADIKDIKPILKVPITFMEILPWLIGLIILGGVIFGVIYFLGKKKLQPVEKSQPKIRIPSWEIALSKIEELKRDQVWQKGNVKEYYTRLIDILREYFEMRFNVNASEMTSTEIIESLQKHLRREEAIVSLRNVLLLADMAKFAKAQPDQYENEQSIIYGIDIINYSKPSSSEVETNSSKTE